MGSFDSEVINQNRAAHSDPTDEGGWGWGRHWGEESHGPSQASVSAGYQFIISDGQVTAEQLVRGSHLYDVPLSANDSFVIGTGTMTETISQSSGTQVIQYGLEFGSTTQYAVTETSFTVAQPSAALPNGGTLVYDFTIAGGAVTAETRTVTFGVVSHTETVTPPSDAVFTVATGSITESWVEGNQVKTVTFGQPADGTAYVVAARSTTFIAQGGSATALDVDPGHRAMFAIGSDGTVTAAAMVKADGATMAVMPDSHVAFTQLEPGFVEEAISWGNHSRYVVFEDAAGHGVYTEVAHGAGTAVDLVGLKAQLAELPAALAAAV